MPSLLPFDRIDQFRSARSVDATVPDYVVQAVRTLDERQEIEPFILSILADPNETPHGPAEIADIFTHKVTVDGTSGLAAFILKGKSFPTVRPAHVGHQIYRLEKITALRTAVLAASGNVLDAAKEQFCSTAQRLGCDYVILDASDLGRLFIANGFLCPRDGGRIAAGRCRCGYSPHIRILNHLQVESLRALREAHALQQAAGVIILPPGGGKTRIAAEDVRRSHAGCALYVAQSHEILDVAQAEFEAVLGVTAVKRHLGLRTLRDLAQVNLATIQLLRSHLSQVPDDAFDYVIIDEFHHAAAPSYRALLARLEPPFLLGLTATPFRADRQDILALCNHNVLANFELRTGIETGILCPYHYYGCFDDVDYSAIEHNGIRYTIRDLERALIVPARDDAIVGKWVEHAERLPTIAFCCSHRHAERVAASFQRHGIPAATYLADTPRDQRSALSAQLGAGHLKVLCAVDVLNEGADLPFVECLLFLRPTESKRIFYQQLGRGLRRAVGKAHCLVIDFIGNFRNAYRIVEYQGLQPAEADEPGVGVARARQGREVLNLPSGCQVHFEDRVIDLFAQQALHPRFATRHNIGRILVYQYERLRRRLSRPPSRREVDRNCLLDSHFYVQVFGSWKHFEGLADSI
jgi:superfamily II DNA or RNA helicase